MKLREPRFITWLVSIVISVVACISIFITIPHVSPRAFWVLALGYLVLLIGTIQILKESSRIRIFRVKAAGDDQLSARLSHPAFAPPEWYKRIQTG